MCPREKDGSGTGQGGRAHLCHAARATVLLVGMAGGFSADSDTLLAGAAHQIGPLMSAMTPAEGARRYCALAGHAVQGVLVVAGGFLLVRVLASATHGVFHVDRPDSELVFGLSIFMTALALVAELATHSRLRPGYRVSILFGLVVALLPAAMAIGGLRVSVPLDAYGGLLLLVLLPVRWAVAAFLTARGNDASR